jgi:predicted phosphatase
MASPDTILKLDTLVMIQTKFGFHWSSTFRGEDFWKSLRRTTDDDNGRQVMAIAHMTLWVRWAKNRLTFMTVFTWKCEVFITYRDRYFMVL